MVSVMLGIFAVVTTEILPIGLLTSIGASFTVSDGMAGLMMTMPGFLAAVAAPLVTVATARFDRRLMLCVFMLLLALANFSAVPLGSVLGVPTGTLVGDLAGWRTAFTIMGVLTVGVLVMLLLFVLPLPPIQATRMGVLNGILRSVDTRFALLLTFLVVLAHFGTYTYVTPFLEQVTHVSVGLVTAFLLLYGAAGVLGNFLGGAWAARYPRIVFGLAGVLIAAAPLLLPVLGRGGPARWCC